MTWQIKQGDREPAIEAQLLINDEPIDLTGRTVRFLMRNESTGASKVAATATVTDATNGMVAYEWGAADTDTPGLYRIEWEVTTSGLKRTIPNQGYVYIRILPEVG